MRDAMRAFGLDPAAIPRAARRSDEVLAYLELHIEQGPVLEWEDLPVGVVTAISGASRFLITLGGQAGHAGTVPMGLRRDALAGAAECVLAVETLCTAREGVVGTVGRITAEPGATNVIPGRVRFTIDIRAGGDPLRLAAVAEVMAAIEAIAARRQLEATVTRMHDNQTATCAPWLRAQLGEAIAAAGIRVCELPSGAGHDGMAMADLTDIGMLFVRCRGGISHNPAEHVDSGGCGCRRRGLALYSAKFPAEARMNVVAPANHRRLPRCQSRCGNPLSRRAGPRAFGQSTGRLRAPRRTGCGPAGRAGFCGGAPSCAGRQGARRRHDQRHQSGGARALRRWPGDRAQCAWRCGAAGPRLDRRPLWRRDPRRLHVRARCRGLQIRLRHLCLCVAGAARCGASWHQARRHCRAASHL